MRVLGVDVGRRRIGLALSDPAAILARPWRTIHAGATPQASAVQVAALVAAAGGDEDPSDGIETIVVGLPRRLGGEDTHETAGARDFADALRRVAGVDVHLQDERLTSREAERRLAEWEPDWRRRKARIDAVAAAIILQDYLDQRAGRAVPGAAW
jgi:putative Holliday junction resolvase